MHKEIWSTHENLEIAENSIKEAERAHRRQLESLERQLVGAKKKADAERHLHETSLKEIEDGFVSFVKDVFRARI